MRDREYFHGRTQALDEFIRHLHQDRLTVLHAPSGAGKSSLLQAGLMPRLITSGHLPIMVRLYSRDPALAIKKSLIVGEKLTPKLIQLSLRDFLHQALELLAPETTIFICLDQFEEIFTQVAQQDRRQFTESLADCLDDESLQVYWIISVRKNYLSKVSELAPSIPNPLANTYPLKSLTEPEATEVIIAPLESFKEQFAPSLVENILTELGIENILPAYLQLVCSDLYNHLPEGEVVITESLYQTRGRANGIIKDYLAKILRERLTASQRQIARRLLEALVTSEGHRAIRSQIDLIREASTSETTSDEILTVLDKLAESSIVRREDIDEAGLCYELVHDFLTQQIHLEPEIKARKEAEELLARGLIRWQRHHLLIPEQELKIIEIQNKVLQLADETIILLVLSTAFNKRKPQQWLVKLSNRGRRQLIGELAKQPMYRLTAWEVNVLWLLRRELTQSLRRYIVRRYLLRQAGTVAISFAALAILVIITLNVFEFLLPPIETGWRKISIHDPNGILVEPDELAIDGDSLIYVLDLEQEAIFSTVEVGQLWENECPLPSDVQFIEDFIVVQQNFYYLTSESLYIQDENCQWHKLDSLEQYSLGEKLQIFDVPANEPNTLFVGIANRGVFKTTDGGQRWEHMPQILGGELYAMAIREANMVVATDRGIWRSQDFGTAWQLMETDSISRSGTELIVDIVFPSPSSTDLFFVVFSNGQIRDANIISSELREWPIDQLPAGITTLDAKSHTALYALADQMLYCRQEWRWQQLGWWLTILGQDVPCGNEVETSSLQP